MLPFDAVPLAALLVVIVLAAGCLGGPAAESTPDPSATSAPPEPTTTVPETTPTLTPTETPSGHVRASNDPDPDHAVRLANDWNQSVTVRVTVVREATNETVHEGTYDIAAGEERTVYNTVDAKPDGIEAFAVTATALNATESLTVETSKCYGDVFVEITDDGTLYPYYEIC